ncbi:hypothetical protein NUW58_g6272 [Xylaria curta]|uniref:Uncharacterized protein n=1 Tax=Xylaria curta TaxID=42375 RepID=A0ACC1NYB4_9PEZI|nr:hypothetical protein NUW58_g6272 [Xylaria curta]
MLKTINAQNPGRASHRYGKPEHHQYDNDASFSLEKTTIEPRLERIAEKRGDNLNDPTRIWGSIVDGQWVTQTTTLAALIVRTTISVQAIVATPMLTAFLLETRGIRLQDAAEVSILRFSNPGPLLSLPVLFQSTQDLKGWAILILIALLAVVTTALRFVSTILFTDIRQGLLSGSLQSSAHIIEYSELATPRDDVADTGVSVRGFVPIRNETVRSQLRLYEGMAALFDTRVVCSRPNLTFTEFGPIYNNRLSDEQSGPWQTFAVLDEPKNNAKVRVSLCYDALGGPTRSIPHDYNVFFNLTTQLPPEPGFVYISRGSHPVETSDIRRPLGATKNPTGVSSVDPGDSPI